MKASEYITPIIIFIVFQFIAFFILFWRPKKRVEKIKAGDIVSRKSLIELWKLSKEFERILKELELAIKNKR